MTGPIIYLRMYTCIYGTLVYLKKKQLSVNIVTEHLYKYIQFHGLFSIVNVFVLMMPIRVSAFNVRSASLYYILYILYSSL